MNKKSCAKCLKIKHISEFNFKNKSKNILHSYCKKCCKVYKANYNNKMKNNIDYRLKRSIRSRKTDAVNVELRKGNIWKQLGCSIEEYKTYLEKKFQDGMSWDNYGKWEIDHISGCNKFDLSKETEQDKCFHYTNTQPLWKMDNIIKS